VEPNRWAFRGNRFVEVPISVAEYRNMGGRAGRYRLNDEFGRSIILSGTQFERDRYWGNYVDASVERLVSRLGQSPILDICLNLIASGLVQTIDELIDFLVASFWGFDFQQRQQDKDELVSRVQEAIRVLIEKDLVEEMQDKVYDFVASQGRVIGQLEQKLELLEGPRSREPRQSSEGEVVTIRETDRSSEHSPNDVEIVDVIRYNQQNNEGG